MPQVDGLPDTSEALQSMYPQAEKGSVIEIEPTDELEKIFEDCKSYEKSIKTLEQFIEEGKNKIKALMGENAAATIGKHKAFWYNTSGRVTIDTKRLQADHPDIFNEYKKVGKASRKFTMK